MLQACALYEEPLVRIEPSRPPGLEKDIQTKPCMSKDARVMGSAAVWTVWSAPTRKDGLTDEPGAWRCGMQNETYGASSLPNKGLGYHLLSGRGQYQQRGHIQHTQHNNQRTVGTVGTYCPAHLGVGVFPLDH